MKKEAAGMNSSMDRSHLALYLFFSIEVVRMLMARMCEASFLSPVSSSGPCCPIYSSSRAFLILGQGSFKSPLEVRPP